MAAATPNQTLPLQPQAQNPQSQQQGPQPISLPAPSTFDILPALHELLARIDHAFNSSSTSSAETNNPDPQTSPSEPTETNAHYADLSPLDPKDLPTEVLAIKTRIRRALREIGELPDVGRGVEEQRLEIERLERRVERQRGMVRLLGELGGGLREG